MQVLYPLRIYREGEKEIHVGTVYISGNYVNRCGSIRSGVSPLLFFRSHSLLESFLTIYMLSRLDSSDTLQVDLSWVREW